MINYIVYTLCNPVACTLSILSLFWCFVYRLKCSPLFFCSYNLLSYLQHSADKVGKKKQHSADKVGQNKQLSADKVGQNKQHSADKVGQKKQHSADKVGQKKTAFSRQGRSE